jgi:hypothetical protein
MEVRAHANCSRLRGPAGLIMGETVVRDRKHSGWTVARLAMGLMGVVLLTGLCLAVPCVRRASPQGRGLVLCCVILPLAAAAALWVAPPFTSWRARLAYLFTWCGTFPVNRCPRRFDGATFVQLLAATAVLAAAVAGVEVAPDHGPGLLVRWLSGGIALLAFAEMITAGLPFVAALLGVTVPALMRSPYRSASIGEFWTQRWNILTSQKIFRAGCFVPLARRSPAFALCAAFAFSAAWHALLGLMVLGYGRWRLCLACGAFFLVQPLFIAAERRLGVRRWRPIAKHGWTLAVLTLISPLFVEPALQVFELGWSGLEGVLWPTAVALAFVLLMSSIVSLGSLAARPATVGEAGL